MADEIKQQDVPQAEQQEVPQEAEITREQELEAEIETLKGDMN